MTQDSRYVGPSNPTEPTMFHSHPDGSTCDYDERTRAFVKKGTNDYCNDPVNSGTIRYADVMPDDARVDIRKIDRTWNDLYQHVQVNITLPPQFKLLLKPFTDAEGGWYYQIECERPDTFTGVMGKGHGGKARLGVHMTQNELVQCAWGLFRGYFEHEAREGFQWKGRRIFGPHIDSDALWEVAERTEYRS